MKPYALYIGVAAGICTGISMLPQLIKLIRKKKADDISIPMILILLSGLGLWISYGIVQEDWPVIITNSFSLLVNLLMVFFAVKYKK